VCVCVCVCVCVWYAVVLLTLEVLYPLTSNTRILKEVVNKGLSQAAMRKGSRVAKTASISYLSYRFWFRYFNIFLHLYGPTDRILQLHLRCATHTLTVPVYSLCRSPSPRSRTLAYSHKVVRSSSLPFNCFHPFNPYYMDYSFANHRGMEGWVGLVGWPL